MVWGLLTYNCQLTTTLAAVPYHQLLTTVKEFGRGILDLVFPVSCLVCGRDGTYLCESCLAKLPRLDKQLCIVCHKPSPYGKTHPDCVSRNTVDGAVAGLNYKNKHVQKLENVSGCCGCRVGACFFRCLGLQWRFTGGRQDAVSSDKDAVTNDRESSFFDTACCAYALRICKDQIG